MVAPRADGSAGAGAVASANGETAKEIAQASAATAETAGMGATTGMGATAEEGTPGAGQDPSTDVEVPTEAGEPAELEKGGTEATPLPLADKDMATALDDPGAPAADIADDDARNSGGNRGRGAPRGQRGGNRGRVGRGGRSGGGARTDPSSGAEETGQEVSGPKRSTRLQASKARA